jgi:hypothetical protein
VQALVGEGRPDVAGRAVRLATEDREARDLLVIERVRIPAYMAIEGRAAGENRSHVAGERARDLLTRQPETLLGIGEGQIHLRRIRDGMEDLVFECGEAAVPGERPAPGTIQQRRDVPPARLPSGLSAKAENGMGTPLAAPGYPSGGVVERNRVPVRGPAGGESDNMLEVVRRPGTGAHIEIGESNLFEAFVALYVVESARLRHADRHDAADLPPHQFLTSGGHIHGPEVVVARRSLMKRMRVPSDVQTGRSFLPGVVTSGRSLEPFAARR